MDKENNTKYIVRIICTIITLISNTYLLCFISRKLWKQIKTFNNIFVLCILYIVSSTIATLYNFLYRFFLKPSDCKVSDIFEESLLSFVRSVLLLFYIVMIYELFENCESVKNGIII
eukprot:264744_1